MKQLQSWYAEGLGLQVGELAVSHLSRILQKLCGYYLLHVGEIGWKLESPIRYQLCLTQSGQGFVPMTIQGSYTDFPIQEASIDAVLLPHVLEFEDDPEEVLAEAARVLIPEGHLIVIGFNPYSFLGMTRFSKQAHLWSRSQISRLLRALNFEMVESRTFFFQPKNMEALGQALWPALGGVYLLVAKKKVLAMTPIQAAWMRKWEKVPSSVVQPVAYEKSS